MRLPAKAVDAHGRAAFVANRSPSFQVQVGWPGKATVGAGRGALCENRSASGAVRSQVAGDDRAPTVPFDRRRTPRWPGQLRYSTRFAAKKFPQPARPYALWCRRPARRGSGLWCRRPACIRRQPTAPARRRRRGPPA